MKFIGLTRGGTEGVIAIVEVDGDNKYFERIALLSLLEKATNESKLELSKALNELIAVANLEDVPEFEGGIPQQGSLFG